MSNNANKIFLVVGTLLLITISICARLLPHLANVAPIGALALFAGVYLPKRWAFVVPMVAMFVSDLFVGFYTLPVMILVYGSFLVMVGIGTMVRKNVSCEANGEAWMTIGLGALSGSIIFFIATNFGVWAFTNLYQHNFSGLMSAYTMGLPFFKWTVIGDLAWSVAFFGGYAIARSLILNKKYLTLSWKSLLTSSQK